MGEKIRIHVGGLGLNVKEDELKKTFTSPNMGTVDSVEIIRSKGRSFAYLDFVPASDKGLAKLFSTYNGCSWKGGKLRLEKAKEHYLVHLKREWDEDVKLATNLASQNVDDALEKVYSLEKRKKEDMEKMQLRLFFPKLRKIKSVPFKGTGKHKYSFQRVEVPPLPIHFCDCEEHSGHPETAGGNASNHVDEDLGVREEELIMMKSVMSKILERENFPNATCAETGFTMEENNSGMSLNNLQVDVQEDDQVSDEDNLIINIVSGSNDRITFSKDQTKEAAPVKWDALFEEPKTSNDRHQKRNITASNKKRRSPFDVDDRNHISAKKRTRGHLDIVEKNSDNTVNSQQEIEIGSEQLDHDASLSQGSQNMGAAEDRNALGSTYSTSDGPEKEEQQRSDVPIPPGLTEKENQSSQSKEVKKTTNILLDKPSATVDKSTRGASWLQKSSWMQLVGDTHNNSFSISQVLPGVTFEKQELPQFSEFGFSRNNKHNKSLEKDRKSCVKEVGKLGGGSSKNSATVSDKIDVDASIRNEENHSHPIGGNSNLDSELKIVKDNNETSISAVGQNVPTSLKQPSLGNIVTSEVCPFMRSAASIKEWTKTKAALSGSLKKKGKGK